jgi:hypothetical protein
MATRARSVRRYYVLSCPVDSFTLIASIGFWVGENPSKALTARGLKLWYEAELERRAAAKASIR